MRGCKWDWSRLVTATTPKATVAKYQAQAQEIITKRAEANRVSPKVEAIDWAYWEKEIAAPGVVASLRKEYEALQFPTPTLDSTTQKVISETETAIAKSGGEAKLAEHELVESDKMITKFERLKANGMTYRMDQWVEELPHMEQEFHSWRENWTFLPTQDELNLQSVDWKPVKATILAGGNPKFPATSQPITEGDVNSEEEAKLQREGRWSIARWFTAKEDRDRIQARVDQLLASK